MPPSRLGGGRCLHLLSECSGFRSTWRVPTPQHLTSHLSRGSASTLRNESHLHTCNRWVSGRFFFLTSCRKHLLPQHFLSKQSCKGKKVTRQDEAGVRSPFPGISLGGSFYLRNIHSRVGGGQRGREETGFLGSRSCRPPPSLRFPWVEWAQCSPHGSQRLRGPRVIGWRREQQVLSQGWHSGRPRGSSRSLPGVPASQARFLASSGHPRPPGFPRHGSPGSLSLSKPGSPSTWGLLLSAPQTHPTALPAA